MLLVVTVLWSRPMGRDATTKLLRPLEFDSSLIALTQKKLSDAKPNELIPGRPDVWRNVPITASSSISLHTKRGFRWQPTPSCCQSFEQRCDGVQLIGRMFITLTVSTEPHTGKLHQRLASSELPNLLSSCLERVQQHPGAVDSAGTVAAGAACVGKCNRWGFSWWFPI